MLGIIVHKHVYIHTSHTYLNHLLCREPIKTLQHKFHTYNEIRSQSNEEKIPKHIMRKKRHKQKTFHFSHFLYYISLVRRNDEINT